MFYTMIIILQGQTSEGFALYMSGLKRTTTTTTTPTTTPTTTTTTTVTTLTVTTTTITTTTGRSGMNRRLPGGRI